LEVPGIDGRIILSWVFRRSDGGDMDLTQNRDRWWELVNGVMNNQVL